MVDFNKLALFLLRVADNIKNLTIKRLDYARSIFQQQLKDLIFLLFSTLNLIATFFLLLRENKFTYLKTNQINCNSTIEKLKLFQIFHFRDHFHKTQIRYSFK